MRVCTFQQRGIRKIGVMYDESRIVDLQAAHTAMLFRRYGEKAHRLTEILVPGSMKEFIEEGTASLDTAREVVTYIKESGTIQGPGEEPIVFGLEDVAIKAPIFNPPKFFCATVTRKDTWERAIKPANPHPTYFIKLHTCIVGPYDPIEIPDVGVVGPEVEVAAIIGKRGKNLSAESVQEHIFGYTIHNDITAHELRKTSEWITVIRENGSREKLTYQGRYKCFDTFAPMGPWIVTADEFDDVNEQALSMESRLNGNIVQKGTTADTVYSFTDFIVHLSKAHTLEPGDIVSGGTVLPAPGWSMNTIDLRKIGGVLESEIEGIGMMKNPIVAV